MSRIGRLVVAGTLSVAVGAGVMAFAAPAQAAQVRPQSEGDCMQVLTANGYSAETGYPEFLLARMCRIAAMTSDYSGFSESLASMGIDQETIDNAFGAAQE
jgi:hypothetical protein